MKECSRCKNLSPDSASSCAQCGMVLDQAMIARVARARMPTVTEASAMAAPPSQTYGEYRPSPPPVASTPLSRPVASSFAVTEPPPARPTVASPSRRGQTVYMPAPSSGTGSPAPVAATRRLIAVLVTYSWKPEGQIFPIYEGRNLIGSAEQCDVRLPDDPGLSATNSHITFRQNFVIGDLVSMSGTDLDGVAVEEQFKPLKNLAKIRAGSTNFTFVIVDPVLLGVT